MFTILKILKEKEAEISEAFVDKTKTNAVTRTSTVDRLSTLLKGNLLQMIEQMYVVSRNLV